MGKRLESNYRECLQRQESVSYEEELEFEGETTTWRTQLTPILVDGEVEEIVGAAHEITTLRTSQRELERQTTLFEQAQEIADLGAWETDFRRGEGWWTEKISDIFSLPAECDPSLERRFECYHPDDRERLENAQQEAVEDGKAYDLELRLLGDDESKKWVRTRGAPRIEDGEVVAVRGTIQDITARKERERDLQATHHRLELALKAANAGFWEVDLEQDRLHWDEFSKRMGGTRPKNSMARSKSSPGKSIPTTCRWSRAGTSAQSRRRPNIERSSEFNRTKTRPRGSMPEHVF
jgi:PAS domain-containing protein